MGKAREPQRQQRFPLELLEQSKEAKLAYFKAYTVAHPLLSQADTKVWNAIRALDYLETRPEADMKRIGLTGISGGGAMTWYTAAVDERISVAAPVCSTFTFGSQAEHWLARGQCDCIYYHNTYAWDFPTVGALIAPRPLLLLHSANDSVTPTEQSIDLFLHAGQPTDLHLVAGTDHFIFNEGNRLVVDLVRDWLAQHFPAR